MSGIIRTLDAVPDPAFAQRLIGDGLAIDPLDDFVRSPIAGTVVAIAETGHAITVRSESGVEILIHIGIDTVQLRGRGFDVLVDVDQTVAKDEALLQLDIDLLGREAKSLVTPILIVSGHLSVPVIAEGELVTSGDAILRIDLDSEANTSPKPIPHGRSTAHILFELELPHGLHARPSGRVAALVKSFEGTVTITHGEKSADASSVTGLMSLGTRLGSEIEIRAIGERPREVAISIANLLQQLAQTEGDEIASSKAAVDEQTLPTTEVSRSNKAIKAVVASPGLAIGPAFLLQAFDLQISEEGSGYEVEQGRLSQAIEHVSAMLSQTITAAEEAAKTIAEAHHEIVQDSAIRGAAEKAMFDGASAEFAWRTASRSQELELQSTGSERLQERAIDLRDVERRILEHLGGVSTELGAQIPTGSILICSDIEPSLLISMPKGIIAGICTAQGGATSHAAILAASAGIPMLVAAGEAVLSFKNACSVMLDAESGYFDPEPMPEVVQEVSKRVALRKAHMHSSKLAAQQLCHLSDGTRIEVFANLANAEDGHSAVANGAEGCGLLRTEFIFANSSTAPNEEAQRRIYREIAETLDDRPVIIRTLDVGGDKPIEYLPFPEEANPALGMRGIRFSLKEEGLLRTQLRAMIQAVPSRQLRIMLPMVVEVDEIICVRRVLETQCAELEIRPDFQVGIMVETPAAALLASQLAVHADFLSIGSNDLSQYILAMDRGNAQLASRVDAYHPSVLSAIEMTGRGAARHGRWLGICGGLASDYRAAPLLVGLGCQELSAVPGAIPQIKQTLQAWSKDRCRSLAIRALELDSAAEVRALVSGEVQ